MPELRTWSREEIATTADRLAIHARLTPREVDVLRCLALGDSYADIAKRLQISVSTVKSHLQAALVTMGARKATQAVALAYEYGVLQAGDARREVPRG